ncbi:hypothetical protein D5085_10290 [Ectothiorhodospiraceae bacterium BW-2]|nr:hypothetical protein D5085_10290 [Ectothiorhodospiraceae bacterium BW-2]
MRLSLIPTALMAVLLCLPLTVSAVELPHSTALLHYSDWLRLQPRSGAHLASLPLLRQLMPQLLTDERKRLRIRYLGHEQGLMWAKELADWLTALGLPLHRIELLPGATADPHQLRLEVISP